MVVSCACGMQKRKHAYTKTVLRWKRHRQFLRNNCIRWDNKLWTKHTLSYSILRAHSYITYTFLYSYIHTFIHPCAIMHVHPLVHWYIHESIAGYIHTCTYTLIHTFIHSCIRPFIYSWIRPFTHTTCIHHFIQYHRLHSLPVEEEDTNCYYENERDDATSHRQGNCRRFTIICNTDWDCFTFTTVGNVYVTVIFFLCYRTRSNIYDFHCFTSVLPYIMDITL